MKITPEDIVLCRRWGGAPSTEMEATPEVGYWTWEIFSYHCATDGHPSSILSVHYVSIVFKQLAIKSLVFSHDYSSVNLFYKKSNIERVSLPYPSYVCKFKLPSVL